MGLLCLKQTRATRKGAQRRGKTWQAPGNGSNFPAARHRDVRAQQLEARIPSGGGPGGCRSAEPRLVVKNDNRSWSTSAAGILFAVFLTPLFVGLEAADRQPVTAGRPGQFLGAMPTEYPNWFKESFLELGDDVTEAAETNRRVLILFHQDGCPYCNALVERNLAQKDIAAAMTSKFCRIAVSISL